MLVTQPAPLPANFHGSRPAAEANRIIFSRIGYMSPSGERGNRGNAVAASSRLPEG